VESASDVVHQYFAAFDEEGPDVAQEFWHPEIEWHNLAGDVVSGREAMHRYCSEWKETIAGLRGEVETITDEGERTVVLVRNSGRGRTSGVPASGSYYLVCVVREGLIVSGHEFAAREEALDSGE
jgi:ketosteroid isomerase-like protein